MKTKLAMKTKLLGLGVYQLSRLLAMTVRVECKAFASYDPKQQYLFAFWHGQQFLPCFQLQEHLNLKAAMTSPSRDGSILAVVLAKLGYEVIRGSSTNQPLRALLQLGQKVAAGYSVGFAVDGPRGPACQAKPGLVYLALRYGVPIVPIAVAYQQAYVFTKAWDRFQLPKPFSKAVMYMAEPINCQLDTDSSTKLTINHPLVIKYQQVLNQELLQAEVIANSFLK